jgi:hypothetical protein
MVDSPDAATHPAAARSAERAVDLAEASCFNF